MTTDWQMRRRKLDELMTVDKLTDWLRGQPPEKGYVWSDPVFCLMGRYLAEQGSHWGEASYSELPGYREIAEAKPWTYGAALERAEQHKALPPPDDTKVLQIEAPQERELIHEPSPGDVRLSASELHPEGGDGAVARGSESLRLLPGAAAP